MQTTEKSWQTEFYPKDVNALQLACKARESINQAPCQRTASQQCDQPVRNRLCAGLDILFFWMWIRKCSLGSSWGTAWPRWRSGPGGDTPRCCGSTDCPSSAGSEPGGRSEKKEANCREKSNESDRCTSADQVKLFLGWQASRKDERLHNWNPYFSCKTQINMGPA